MRESGPGEEMRVHTSGELAFCRTLVLMFGVSPADFAAFRAEFQGLYNFEGFFGNFVETPLNIV